MGKTQLRAGDPEGFLRAFTDEVGDLQKLFHVRIVGEFVPTTRRGVLQFTLAAWKLSGGCKDFPMARIRLDFPSAQVQSLEAFLFSLVVRMNAMLEQAVEQEQMYR